MSGVLTFPTQRDDVPADIVARLAAHARPGDRRVDDAHITYRFPSAERMCGFAARVAAGQPDAYLISGYHPDYPDYAWSGAALPTALWMGATVGWPEAVPLATGAYDRLTAKRLRSRIPVPVMMDEPGDEVDVASYLSGDDAFVGCAPSDRIGIGRGSVVLRHSLFASAYVSAEEIITQGAVAAAVVHLLETSGVQVAIDLDMHARFGSYGMDLECRIKDFGAPMDLPRVMYWLAHLSALRRVVFAVTAEHFENHMAVSHKDGPDVVRVGAAQVGGDVVEMAQATLAAAGIELEG